MSDTVILAIVNALVVISGTAAGVYTLRLKLQQTHTALEQNTAITQEAVDVSKHVEEAVNGQRTAMVAKIATLQEKTLDLEATVRGLEADIVILKGKT